MAVWLFIENKNFDSKTRNNQLKCIRSRMEFLPSNCAANSVGAANNLFGILINTLVAAHCAMAPEDKWPKDYGMTATHKG